MPPQVLAFYTAVYVDVRGKLLNNIDMENTLNLLLQDTSLKWYTVMNGKPQGPLSAKEIVQRLQANELNFASHVWKKGFSGWTRIYDVIDFKPMLPGEPPLSLIVEIQKNEQSAPPLAPKQKEELRTWYIYLDEANYGPISDREVESLIESGRITAGTFMWQKGFADWQPAKDIAAWAKAVSASKASSSSVAKSDKRSTPRKPFETKILLTDGKEVGWAICRDISVGGMQVLMDHAPGPVGTTLKLNVSEHGKIPGFACEGEIMRVLEDGRGFSLRFMHLTAEAKSAIEKHIAS